MKKQASKVAHNQPRPFYFTVQPRIDFSYYEISGPDICSLICGRFAVLNSQKRFLTSYWFVEDSEWYKIDQGNHLDSYTISSESFRSFRGPLFCEPVTGRELFFCCCLQQTGSNCPMSIKGENR